MLLLATVQFVTMLQLLELHAHCFMANELQIKYGYNKNWRTDQVEWRRQVFNLLCCVMEHLLHCVQCQNPFYH